MFPCLHTHKGLKTIATNQPTKTKNQTNKKQQQKTTTKPNKRKQQKNKIKNKIKYIYNKTPRYFLSQTTQNMCKSSIENRDIILTTDG